MKADHPSANNTKKRHQLSCSTLDVNACIDDQQHGKGCAGAIPLNSKDGHSRATATAPQPQTVSALNLFGKTSYSRNLSRAGQCSFGHRRPVGTVRRLSHITAFRSARLRSPLSPNKPTGNFSSPWRPFILFKSKGSTGTEVQRTMAR